MFLTIATDLDGYKAPGVGRSLNAARDHARKYLWGLGGNPEYVTFEDHETPEAMWAALAGTDQPNAVGRGIHAMKAGDATLRLLTPKQTAEALDVSPGTVKNWSKDGRITQLEGEYRTAQGKTQRLTFYLKAEVDALAGRSSSPQPSPTAAPPQPQAR